MAAVAPPATRPALSAVPAVVSGVMLAGYLAGVSAFYSGGSGLLIGAGLLAMVWLLVGWIFGLGQVLYGLIRGAAHRRTLLHGMVNLTLHGWFLVAIIHGWAFTA